MRQLYTLTWHVENQFTRNPLDVHSFVNFKNCQEISNKKDENMGVSGYNPFKGTLWSIQGWVTSQCVQCWKVTSWRVQWRHLNIATCTHALKSTPVAWQKLNYEPHLQKMNIDLLRICAIPWRELQQARGSLCLWLMKSRELNYKTWSGNVNDFWGIILKKLVS